LRVSITTKVLNITKTRIKLVVKNLDHSQPPVPQATPGKFIFSHSVAINSFSAAPIYTNYLIRVFKFAKEYLSID